MKKKTKNKQDAEARMKRSIEDRLMEKIGVLDACISVLYKEVSDIKIRLTQWGK